MRHTAGCGFVGFVKCSGLVKVATSQKSSTACVSLDTTLPAIPALLIKHVDRSRNGVDGRERGGDGLDVTHIDPHDFDPAVEPPLPP